MLAHAIEVYPALRARWPTQARAMLGAALVLAGRKDRPPAAYADELGPFLALGLTEARIKVGEALETFCTEAASLPELRALAREYLLGGTVEGSEIGRQISALYRRWLVDGTEAVD
jgi:hypothetical protein